jgi:hypothetical protein
MISQIKQMHLKTIVYELGADCFPVIGHSEKSMKNKEWLSGAFNF